VADDLDELARLLAGPVNSLTDQQLVEAIRQAEQIRAASRERTGRLLAELHGRGKSWPAISRETGIRQTTAYDWAQPFLTTEGAEEA
jgi:hypothetical protein